jgi:hypothetical protein
MKRHLFPVQLALPLGCSWTSGPYSTSPLAERLRLDRLDLKIRVKLDNGGIQAFEVQNHLL